MNPSPRVLIIIGSPRAHRSASHSLGSHLAHELNRLSVSSHLVYVSSPKMSPLTAQQLHQSMDSAETVVFVFPLYLDQPPSGLMKLMEDYALHLQNGAASKPKALAVLVHSRLPEARHSDTAIAILKRFADLEEIKWLGGLAFGGSRTIRAGRPLSASGFSGYNAMRAIRKTARALAKGLPVPREAVRIMRGAGLPTKLYTWLANLVMRRHARKTGILNHIRAKPYDPSSPSHS